MAEVLEGDVVLHREDNGRVEILQAPPITRISLELLIQDADRHLVQVRGDRVALAGQVSYRVVAWDQHSHALLLERDDTPGSGPGTHPPAEQPVAAWPAGAGTKGA